MVFIPSLALRPSSLILRVIMLADAASQGCTTCCCHCDWLQLLPRPWRVLPLQVALLQKENKSVNGHLKAAQSARAAAQRAASQLQQEIADLAHAQGPAAVRLRRGVSGSVSNAVITRNIAVVAQVKMDGYGTILDRDGRAFIVT